MAVADLEQNDGLTGVKPKELASVMHSKVEVDSPLPINLDL